MYWKVFSIFRFWLFRRQDPAFSKDNRLSRFPGVTTSSGIYSLPASTECFPQPWNTLLQLDPYRLPLTKLHCEIVGDTSKPLASLALPAWLSGFASHLKPWALQEQPGSPSGVRWPWFVWAYRLSLDDISLKFSEVFFFIVTGSGSWLPEWHCRVCSGCRLICQTPSICICRRCWDEVRSCLADRGSCLYLQSSSNGRILGEWNSWYRWTYSVLTEGGYVQDVILLLVERKDKSSLAAIILMIIVYWSKMEGTV